MYPRLGIWLVANTASNRSITKLGLANSISQYVRVLFPGNRAGVMCGILFRLVRCERHVCIVSFGMHYATCNPTILRLKATEDVTWGVMPRLARSDGMRGRRMQTGALFEMVQRHWFMLWIVHQNPYISIQYYTTVAPFVAYTTCQGVTLSCSSSSRYIQTNLSTQALCRTSKITPEMPHHPNPPHFITCPLSMSSSRDHKSNRGPVNA